MKYPVIIVAILSGLLCGCGSIKKPTTHTDVPSLKYARNYVSDVKDYNAKALKSNNEIDIEIQKLLEGAE